MLKVEVVLDFDQIKECFENAEIKYSQKKLKVIMENIVDADMDIKERLEDALKEFIEEMITEEFE